jgi:hypothetical protein
MMLIQFEPMAPDFERQARSVGSWCTESRMVATKELSEVCCVLYALQHHAHLAFAYCAICGGGSSRIGSKGRN